MVIVTGYSDRPESKAALEAAIAEAQSHDAKLYVVSVLQDRPAEASRRQHEWAASLEKARRDGEAIEARLAELGIRGGVEVVAATMASPATELLGASHRLEADLVVIGIRRRSRVGKLMMGSVAQEVLLAADCPVLAVKASD